MLNYITGGDYVLKYWIYWRISWLITSLHDNIAFREGWAMFCEYYYSLYIFNDKEFLTCFIEHLRNNLLLSLAAIDLHIKENSYQSVIENIACISKLSLNKCKSIALQAYTTPIDSISISLGLLFF